MKKRGENHHNRLVEQYVPFMWSVDRLRCIAVRIMNKERCFAPTYICMKIIIQPQSPPRMHFLALTQTVLKLEVRAPNA